MVDGLFLHVSGSRDDDQETLRDDPLRVYTRTIAWRLACHFQHCDCLRRAMKLYSDWMDHPDQQYVISDHTVYASFFRTLDDVFL